MRMVRFHVDPEHVVHEPIDGETLAVQLATGAYYSLRGTAHEAWEQLAAGQPLETVAGEMARRYPEAPGAADDVRRFAEQLVEEQLLAEAETGGHDAVEQPPSGERAVTAYAPPSVERYDDMQYFLLLDPIHEVDDVAGWPHAATGAELGG
jgi:hypothetical protein